MVKRTSILLPNYPRTKARGTSVYIENEDGSELFWGSEPNMEAAEAVARELQLELRGIKYVEQTLRVFLSDMAEDLVDLGISYEHVADLIHEGYCNIVRMLKRITP